MTKLDDERFFVVVTDTMHRHAETWMRRHIPDDAHAFVTDVTSGYCQLNVQGPRSRELLQTLTSADLSNEAFPFRAAREIDIGFARVLCVRITYLGELGYELYIPTEQAAHVYDRLVEAGKRVRPAPRRPQGAGQPAHGEGLPRLRPRHRQHRQRASRPASASPSISKKPGGFIGHDAALRAEGGRPADAAPGAGAGARIPSRCCSTPRSCCRDGKPVGYVRAASYGHTLGGAVGLAMIEAGEPIDAGVARARAAGRSTSPASSIPPRSR